MTNQEMWQEFLSKLILNAMAEHKKTYEYEYLEKRQNQIDEFLLTNLDSDQRAFMEEILFEEDLYAERETELVYKKGFKDCVWLLKTLGVLA